MNRTPVLAMLMAISVVTACSGADPADDCRAAVSAYCSRACECDTTAECSIGGDGATIAFDDMDECVGLYELLCGSSRVGDNDWGRCMSDASAAECSGNAVPSQESCSIPD